MMTIYLFVIDHFESYFLAKSYPTGINDGTIKVERISQK